MFSSNIVQKKGFSVVHNNEDIENLEKILPLNPYT
jgi:hypothetical protein